MRLASIVHLAHLSAVSFKERTKKPTELAPHKSAPKKREITKLQYSDAYQCDRESVAGKVNNKNSTKGPPRAPILDLFPED